MKRKFAMKSLLSLLLLSSLILVCFAAVFLERQHAISGHENLCYDKADDSYYKRGEEMNWKVKGCGRRICAGSSGKGHVYAEIHTCGKIDFPPRCHVEVNSDLPYPLCCERVVCP